MIFALAIKVALCFACADSRASAWIGHKLDDLIRAWGPPSASATLSDGSTVADWGYDARGGAFVHNYGNGNWSVSPGGSYHCVARITADKSGTITAAKVDGNLGGCNSLFRDKEAPAA
jgi:hypothetical protein